MLDLDALARIDTAFAGPDRPAPVPVSEPVAVPAAALAASAMAPQCPHLARIAAE